jgi:hypothetical protein
MSHSLHSGLNLVTDWEECHEAAAHLVSGGAPFFLGRVGGSDTDAVVDYLAARNEGTADALQHVTDRHLARVMKFNGFYDLDRSADKFFRYLRLLLQCYEQCARFALVGRQLLNMYFPDNLNPAFRNEPLQDVEKYARLIDGIANNHGQVTCFPYPFYEKIVFDRFTLFRAFSKTLPGKRVLVVSPFSESIEANFGNRCAFFKDYEYPDFDLLTLATPITYSDLPREYYPHADWFETTEALKGQLRELEFDIALLACGSYAVPLGLFIEQELGRQAIYVGGVLQLFFGIMGRRYDNPFFLDQINPDKFILPVERSKYLGHVTVAHDTPRDAFGAYF